MPQDFQTKQTYSLVGRGMVVTLILAVLLALISPARQVKAAADLQVDTITWNVIGLDSNDVTAGPNEFPVGARVCNNGSTVATDLTALLTWDSANSYIGISSGSYNTITIPTLAAGACTDVYYNITVQRTALAYDTTRAYHISVSDSTGITARTPYNREIYVEHLVSQNRNEIVSIAVNGNVIPVGGSANLVVGQTYTITLTGSTSTGYNQLESFINFPNTVFQILNVGSTYTTTALPFTSPIDKLYADACSWVNDTTALNYRSCITDGKAGGTVVNTYTIKILSSPNGVKSINALFYDFSGSSYHYNADNSYSNRWVNVIDPATIDISKVFSPADIPTNGTSSLTFTINNPTEATLAGVAFSDTLPSPVKVANPNGLAYSGCGSPTISAVAGGDLISLTGASIAPLSSCTIRVKVTVNTPGTFNNTTSPVSFVDSTNTVNTGNSASATLTASDNLVPTPTPAACTRVELAKWQFNVNAALPPYPAATSSIVTASSYYSSGTVPGTSIINTNYNNTVGVSPSYSWQTSGFYRLQDTFSAANSAYYRFAVDTTGYEQVQFSFSASRATNGPHDAYVYYSNTTTPSNQYAYYNEILPATTTWVTTSNLSFTGLTNTSGSTYFYIYGYDVQNLNTSADMYLDDVVVTGCAAPPKFPTITKSFSVPTQNVGAEAIMTFQLTNSNAGTTLTGVGFTDPLPVGLLVADTPSVTNTCGGTFSAEPGSMTIGLAGGTITAGSSCTITLNVLVTKAGQLTNQTEQITSTQTGKNTGDGGTATASITGVLLPPSIQKSFAPDPILVNGTSVLGLTITNPNPNDALTNLIFTDTYPSGLVNIASSPTKTNTCGGTLTAAAGAGSASLSGGSISAGGSCSIEIYVTSGTAATYSNSVTIYNGASAGNTSTAGLTVNAFSARLSLLKQISTSATGPWTSGVTVDAGTNVYYRFTVENLGDVALTGPAVSDTNLGVVDCTSQLADPLAAYTYDTCVVGPVTASSSAGAYPNTATASGNDPLSAPVTSNTSSATYYIYPDLTVNVTDSVGGNTVAGTPFTWSVATTNGGTTSATFTEGQVILRMALPEGIITSSPAMGTYSGVTGWENISCQVIGSNLECVVDPGTTVVIAPSG